jgi:hypothetical protein
MRPFRPDSIRNGPPRLCAAIILRCTNGVNGTKEKTGMSAFVVAVGVQAASPELPESNANAPIRPLRSAICRGVTPPSAPISLAADS